MVYIYWIKNPNDEFQIAAIRINISAVEEINNLSKAGQMEYVRRLDYSNEYLIGRTTYYIKDKEALELYSKMKKVHGVIR